MKRLVVALSLLASLTFVVHGSALAAPGGNSDAAHACQQGGYTSIVGGMPPGNAVTFDNTGQCVSYAAHGGTLYQVSSSTVFVDATVPQFQDTGVNLAPGAVASITAIGNACATVSGGGCAAGAFVGPDGNPSGCNFCLAPGDFNVYNAWCEIRQGSYQSMSSAMARSGVPH